MQQAAYGVGAPELYILGAAWLLFAFAFFSRRRLGRLREMAGNRRSLIGLALQVTGFLIVRIAARPLHAAFLPFGLLGEMAAIVIASGIFALSIWLTHAAVRALGKQWSLAARVVEAHELIKDGPYAYLRHPIYTAMMGMLIGTAVLVSIWQAFLL
ncbi:MAG TPA: isoprenylcysteine carboxylmethyltransferase family protein, partial [Anaerolineales bacterium]|nr:isoprenylcysteine carboxylmethyltransferase family protein [Anaerolineales bacterium]